MTITKPPVIRNLLNNLASAIALPETGERDFLSRGEAAGAKARTSGVTVSAEASIERLRVLANLRAAIPGTSNGE